MDFLVKNIFYENFLYFIFTVVHGDVIDCLIRACGEMDIHLRDTRDPVFHGFYRISEKLRGLNVDQFQRPPFYTDVRHIAEHISDNILFTIRYSIGATEGVAPAVTLIAGKINPDLH
jgi:hypothetical protein